MGLGGQRFTQGVFQKEGQRVGHIWGSMIMHDPGVSA